MNHLQLGRDLYDRKKFGREVSDQLLECWSTGVLSLMSPWQDFSKLLESEVSSLNDCLDCLEHVSFSSGANFLEDILFKAGAARDDAESWLSQLADHTL